MSKVNSRKVAVVGCGFVGSASAFALMQSGLFTEIVLIDADRNKAEGEALDISHGLPFARPMQIHAGTYDDIVDAAIIVVTAGAGQKPGETYYGEFILRPTGSVIISKDIQRRLHRHGIGVVTVIDQGIPVCLHDIQPSADPLHALNS